MALTADQKTEAQFLKTRYQQILRMLESRNTPVSCLMQTIQKNTGIRPRLLAEYCFTAEPDAETLHYEHDPAFGDYDSQLCLAIHKCGGRECDEWSSRYSQFQLTRRDFEIYQLLVTESTVLKLFEAANSAAPSSVAQKPFEVTHNDRRFLRGLRIATD